MAAVPFFARLTLLSAAAFMCGAVCRSEECDSSSESPDNLDTMAFLQYSTELKSRTGEDGKGAVPPAPLAPETLEATEKDVQATPVEAVVAPASPVSASSAETPSAVAELQEPAKPEEEKDASVPVGEDPATAVALNPLKVDFGDEGCRCVGMDGVYGETLLNISHEVVKFPANLGARCAAWYMGVHPKCLDTPAPDWCSQPFCYVDPCKCSGQVPRVDPYMTTELEQNKHIFYSYQTCGGVDTFTATENPTACVNQKTQSKCNALSNKCSWSLSQGCVGSSISGTACDLVRQNAATVWGQDPCQCQGISGKSGDLFSPTENVTYPASTGSECKAWHKDVHPDCKVSGEKPSWCFKKWCYVSPCACSGVIPRVDNLFPGGDFDGDSLFYSYETCGSEDTYTASMNPDACSEQKTKDECDKQEARCMWSFMGNDVGSVCRGIEVATNCVHTAFTRAMQLKDDARTSASAGALPLLLAAFSVTVFP